MTSSPDGWVVRSSAVEEVYKLNKYASTDAGLGLFHRKMAGPILIFGSVES